MTILKTFSIFAKFWEKGEVKTRLAKSIGDSAAARLYHQFLRSTLQMAASWAGRRVIGFSPENRQEDFHELAPDWELIPQISSYSGTKADLGIRMKKFFDTLLGHASNKPSTRDHCVVLIGSDTPLLTLGAIESAFEQLEQNDVVIGPSSDGGYYLIGARNRTPEIFDEIQWSSNQVLDQTVKKLKEKNYEYQLLEVHDDVDEIDDLRRMTDILAARQQRGSELDRLLQLAQSALSNPVTGSLPSNRTASCREATAPPSSPQDRS